MSSGDEFCDVVITDTTVKSTCDVGSVVDHSEFKDACKSASGQHEIRQLVGGSLSDNMGIDELWNFEISFNDDTSGANVHQVSLALFTLGLVFITLST
eukprot:8435294-Ditylum_brightwellii.AAC.1